ncbi:energy-coupled thiamine transporter ThiT [Bacillus sp. REN10]|uniref:energy-coupled thiamine transporter ThiT n=1 Tax=Bacillus sp. REN10 TaxID=2782541 RepID=UPI00193B1DA1|nr:energy-coupled thiamine transporter ThiT [Bacillus sp. REN10]
MDRNKLVTMIEIAVMAGLAQILSLFKFGALWAYGGSISLVMVPIFLMAYRRGLKAGIVTGLIVGLLGLILGGTIVHPIQLALDYPLAYAVLGLAGVMAAASEMNVNRIISGLMLGTFLRLACHFISGVVWFGQYAPDGWPVVLYSIAYNASYLIPEMLITALVLVFLYKTSPSFFKQSTSSVQSVTGVKM